MKSDAIIRRILGAQTNDASVRSQAILNLIKDKEEPEQIELLSICFRERDTVRKELDTLTNEGLTQLQWESLHRTHAPMIDAHIKTSFFKIHTSKEFALQVIKLMNFYDTQEEKVFCIARSLYSVYIPFFELPGDRLSIDSARYDHLTKSNKDEVQLIDYIIKLPFYTVTDEASHLLYILDKFSDNQELRACLLGYYTKKKDAMVDEYYSKRR
jgi:hypothetical protein